jgi:hypothetical protein
MKRITSELLRRRGACRSQVELFIALGGDSLELTEALCLEHAEKFNFYWAANHLLTSGALVEYEHVRRGAQAKYEHIQQSAWAEYEHIRQAALMARADYLHVQPTAWAEYQRACASAFFRAWTSPENQGEEVAV